jgi:CubicO group peptidase (beta-lactamase class C family)
LTGAEAVFARGETMRVTRRLRERMAGAVATAALLGFAAAPSQDPAKLAGAARPASWVAGVLEPVRVKHGVPALAGAVLTGDGLVAAGAVGVRKAGIEIPATSDDKWHLGSDTKAMTAALVALLVERGKLEWETTVEDVFPDLAPELPADLRGVNLLHLLSHRSGLPANVAWFILAKPGLSLTEQRLACLKTLAKVKLIAPPGKPYVYSNLGYVVAGAMAEKIMSASWEDLVRKYVFEPLEMTSAGFGGTGTPGVVDQPWGHGMNGRPVLKNGPEVDNPPVLGPAGTVHMTLADWAKFVADHLRGARGGKGLLRPESYKILETPPFGGNYALGWVAAERDWGGGKVFTHAGSNTMNYAVVWMAPERNFAVLAATNQGAPAGEKACDEAAGALIKYYAAK